MIKKVIMRSSIINAGQAGLQLDIGLLHARYRVTIASNRSPGQI
jgi:NADPH-dependent glutamate synthase beta subunit-like oxidoreductase